MAKRRVHRMTPARRAAITAPPLRGIATVSLSETRFISPEGL
jgi:hypothetical protein